MLIAPARIAHNSVEYDDTIRSAADLVRVNPLSYNVDLSVLNWITAQRKVDGLDVNPVEIVESMTIGVFPLHHAVAVLWG